MSYGPNIGADLRARMWAVVRSLCRERPSDGVLPDLAPRLGDFEFVFSLRDDRLRFIDCKDVWWEYLVPRAAP